MCLQIHSKISLFYCETVANGTGRKPGNQSHYCSLPVQLLVKVKCISAFKVYCSFNHAFIHEIRMLQWWRVKVKSGEDVFFKNPSAILNLTSCSSPLLSPIVLPAGLAADRFLQMCCSPIGSPKTCPHCAVSYFHSDAEESAEDCGWSGSSRVRGGCPPVSQLVRKRD